MKGKISFVILAAMGLSSCLKQDTPLSARDSHNIIEIYAEIPELVASPTTSTFPLFASALPVAPSVDYKIQVNYAGAGTAPEDITVTLAVDPEALEVYNDENGSEFIVMPPSDYTTDTWTLTIPKGQKLATMNVAFKTDQFELSESYALPIKIQSVSSGTVSGNYGTVIYDIKAKNKYDGVYSLRSRFIAPDRPGFNTQTSWTWPGDIYLVTTGANSVAFFDAWGYENYYHPIQTNTFGWSGFGSAAPVFTFDESGKIIKAENWWINPSNGRSFELNPAVTDSRYDEATKTVYAAIIMNQPTFAGLIINDTLVFKRDR